MNILPQIHKFQGERRKICSNLKKKFECNLWFSPQKCWFLPNERDNSITILWIVFELFLIPLMMLDSSEQANTTNKLKFVLIYHNNFFLKFKPWTNVWGCEYGKCNTSQWLRSNCKSKTFKSHLMNKEENSKRREINLKEGYDSVLFFFSFFLFYPVHSTISPK